MTYNGKSKPATDDGVLISDPQGNEQILVFREAYLSDIRQNKSQFQKIQPQIQLFSKRLLWRKTIKHGNMTLESTHHR